MTETNNSENEKKEKYLSCHDLENGIILFSGGIRHCCGLNKNGEPQELIPYESDMEQTIQNVIEQKKQVIERNIQGKKTFCTSCKNLREGYWNTQKKIRQINLSLDHICNLKCQYCNKWDEVYVCQNSIDIPSLMEQFEKSKMVELKYPILYSSGEISIQPRINTILNSIGKYDVCFFSNATKYREEIHDKIKEKYSCLVVSLDCGSRETYKTIKGVDLFDLVCKNIEKYCSDGGKVILKYIVMENNISSKDFKGFLELCLKNNIKTILISRDFNSAGTNIKLKAASVQLIYQAMGKNICCYTDGIYNVFERDFGLMY